MSSFFDSLMKWNDSFESFVSSDDEITNEKIEAITTDKSSTVDKNSDEWGTPRRALFALLSHINRIDRELDLKSNDKNSENKSTDNINPLISKIENSPGIYRIDNWEDSANNREKILNLLSLFKEQSNFSPLGNTAKYEAVKIAISDTCWEQISETIQVAETIPQIGNTWLAPILAILSKFPYYEAAIPEIIYYHFHELDWNTSYPVSIIRHIKPLRRNILMDSLIPRDKKYQCFYITMEIKTFDNKAYCDEYNTSRVLMFKDLTNDILIDDEKWNSHLQNFIKLQAEIASYLQSDVRSYSIRLF